MLTAFYCRKTTEKLPLTFMTMGGFTLVEMLITVSIIVITTAATIPSFTSYMRNQTVQQATELLKSDIRSVQNKAQTGALSDTQISGTTITHWGVRFAPNSSVYEYFISTNTTCPSGAIAASQLQGTGSLNSSMSIKGIGAYTCLFFSVANGDAIGGFSANRIIVGYNGSTATGDCRNLYYTSPGLIYMTGLQTCT
jgi:prepilin-type N-terminal cleavage/methylation domain-containing protein